MLHKSLIVGCAFLLLFFRGGGVKLHKSLIVRFSKFLTTDKINIKIFYFRS